jgi:hypothetical protein
MSSSNVLGVMLLPWLYLLHLHALLFTTGLSPAPADHMHMCNCFSLAVWSWCSRFQMWQALSMQAGICCRKQVQAATADTVTDTANMDTAVMAAVA